ncbi:MAG TPA: O-antigen ligase family protein [Polyangiaceae bacterium]
MKRVLFILIFLAILPESEFEFGQFWTPLRIATEILEWRGLKLPVFDICIILLSLSSRRVRLGRNRAMEKALWLSCGAMLVWSLWGVAHGGSAYQIQFQLYGRIFNLIVSFALAKMLTTRDDFYALGKVVFAAAMYRAGLCIVKYLATVLPGGEPPFVCTTHEDSVLFVTGIVIIIVYLIERRGKMSKAAIVGFALAILAILTAIQFNNRRLAWVSLVASLLLIYFFLPKSEIKTRINRRLLILAPVVALYVIVGTGRPEKIFAPLKSLSSVNDSTDASTKSRDAENMGLLVTLMPNPFMGTGWGKEYIEVDATYSAGASIFVQYKYMPHNSVLALLAFTGCLGFASHWAMLPLCVFLNGRAHRLATNPRTRMIAMFSVCEMVIFINQAWGDLGFFAKVPQLMMAMAVASAIRIPSIAATEGDSRAVRTPKRRVSMSSRVSP